MLTFDRHDKRFNHRVAGACVHEGRVLLTRAESENFWFLPGGRVEFHEDTRTALHREIREELGCQADVRRLLWVVENFFTLSGKTYHEVAFVYEFRPSDPSVLHPTWTRNITDNNTPIEFRWFSLENLADVNLQPNFLKKVLKDPPTDIAHMILRE